MTTEELFERFRSLRILVVGDLMLDRYLWGEVQRISPEAPVPIVDIRQEENRLGGAANVALNLHSLGIKPVLLGIVGRDNEGEYFHETLQRLGLPSEGVMVSRERRTTTKSRVIGNKQQMLRVDKEDRHNISEAERGQLNALLRTILAAKNIDAIVFEDYDKGLLDRILISEIMTQAQAFNIPTFVDPKFRQFFDYGGSTVFKPNLKEIREAMKVSVSATDLPELTDVIAQLHKRMPHTHTLVTLSEQGVLLAGPEHRVEHFPAHVRTITDVSGAGDTVISVMAACMAAGLDASHAAQAANLAGGLVCEEVGVVPVRPSRLKEELERENLLALSTLTKA